MINEWQPSAAVDLSVLKSFIPYGQEILQQPVDLAKTLASSTQKQAQSWLKLSEEDWRPALQALNINELFPLAAFFTLAEKQLNGWQCGDSNPAIWIFRYLRSEQALPEKEKIRQLKQLTDNRFIPYGSVL